MPDGCHHLTRDQRCQIHALNRSGLSGRGIAQELGRDHPTICRELQRNCGRRGCRFMQAQGKATQRRREASAVPWKMTPDLWCQVGECLAQGWSPEQIAGRERIHQCIGADRENGGSLCKHLRRRGKKPNWRGGRNTGRVGIGERPAIVDEKSRVGDWELDTIIGARHRGALVSAVDRASKMTRLARVDRKTAGEVGAALKRRLMPDPVLTLTADNGKELAGHATLSEALDAAFCFTRPCHSWERGRNERSNGLVRQHFPKAADFRAVSNAEVQADEDRLNRRPRKVLGCKTPLEVFGDARAPP